MSATNKGDLKEAYRNEKDSRIRARMLAVHMVRTRKKSIDETAADLMQSERWVHNWLKRYDEGGLDTLRVLPRPGGPRTVSKATIDRIIDRMVPPDALPQHCRGAYARRREQNRTSPTSERSCAGAVCPPRDPRGFTSTGRAKKPSGTGSIGSIDSFRAWKMPDSPCSCRTRHSSCTT